MEAIAGRLEAVAGRLEAIASGLEAIASGLEAIAITFLLLVGWRYVRGVQIAQRVQRQSRLVVTRHLAATGQRGQRSPSPLM